ncbi:MAG: DnaJ domain-containing protein [Deltaproteobacteria bacterium]|nr:DnaJ domain-containing protein [Deltaproteobacteria bacterium]
MSDFKFEIALKPAGQGLLWALWTISEKKASGVLTIEWERFRKQMIFRRGEPIATKSNWPQETFGQFLVRAGRFEAQQIQAELKKKDEAVSKVPLGEWLLQGGLLQPMEVFEFLSKHFQERLFNLIALSHGSLKFQSMPEDQLTQVDASQLPEPFRKLLWNAVKQLFTDAVSKGKLSAYLLRKGYVVKEFPFPLSAQELRVWNQLKTEQAVSSLQGLSLQFFAAATEFDLVEWMKSDEEKLFSDVKDLAEKFSKLQLHEILGLEIDSNTDLVKKSYLELVKKYHPDRLPSQHTSEAKKISEAVFAKINEAYSVMMDPIKREEYRAKLELAKTGGTESLNESLEAELLIPQAKMALRRRHFAQALELYKKIQTVLSEDGEILSDLVYCELMAMVEAKGDFKSKIAPWREQLKAAFKANSSYADNLYYRGLLWKFEGQEDKALSDFDKALDMNPKLADAASEARLLRMRKEKKGSGFFKKS